MKKVLRIGETDEGKGSIPVNVLMRMRALIQGNSGSGKTYLLRVLIEEAARNKIQVLVIDPEGEFKTLREKYPFALVGEGGDERIDIATAEVMAETVMRHRMSAVFDLFETPEELRPRWVKHFLRGLINMPRNLWHPVLVVIDEAQMFCPEKGQKESESYHEVIALCGRGRKRGLCAVLATQRLAILSKSATSQLLIRLVGNTFEQNDIDRVAELMGVTRREREVFDKEIRTLAPGTFYGFGRGLATKKRIEITIAKAKTTHPDVATFKKGKRIPPPPKSLKRLLPKLKSVSGEAEQRADTRKEMMDTIRNLRIKVRELQSQPISQEVKVVIDKRKLRRMVERARAEFWKPLKYANDELRRSYELMQTLQATKPKKFKLPKIDKEFLEGLGGATPIVARSDASAGGPPTKNHLSVKLSELPTGTQSGETPDGYQMDILRALSDFISIGRVEIERSIVAARAKKSIRSSTWDGKIKKAKESGWIIGNGKLLSLTTAGAKLVPPKDAPLTNREMLDSSCEILNDYQEKLFRYLHSIHPKSISRGELATAVGVSSTSSTFDGNLKVIKGLGLTEEPSRGLVRCANSVFVEGF